MIEIKYDSVYPVQDNTHGGFARVVCRSDEGSALVVHTSDEVGEVIKDAYSDTYGEKPTIYQLAASMLKAANYRVIRAEVNKGEDSTKLVTTITILGKDGSFYTLSSKTTDAIALCGFFQDATIEADEDILQEIDNEA